jgi:GTPase Era involved in 16S rRNA processing
MKRVFIKHNPYKLETQIEVDDRKLADNSKLGENSQTGKRLQEWVEELPRMLKDEYNDTDFAVTFHGTSLDFDDLSNAFSLARDEGLLTATLEHKPARETADKEDLIDKVWDEINAKAKEESFKELLKDFLGDDMKDAFAQAKSSDFKVCVVATMSAGKSTLINAMLGDKLMPSKVEACTAIITHIKDVKDDAGTGFRAEIYDEENEKPFVQHNPIKEKILKKYNYRCEDDTSVEGCNKCSICIINKAQKLDDITTSDHPDCYKPNLVREVKIFGNIPFVSSEDVALILIDTPGPNNSRDTRHKKVQSELLGKSSKALVLYIMTGEYGTDDDHDLLKRVADSMAVGGKQSKDRFIFVINKLDELKEEDGDTKKILGNVRSYLKGHDIANPNLFPASALPALNIRLIKSGAYVNEDTIDETKTKVKKLNRNETLHFETYATLPRSILGEINSRVESTRAEWKKAGKPDNENPEEALIHTGVVSIEAAIRQYIQKYAKTAKIKNIADTVMHKLVDVSSDEGSIVDTIKKQLTASEDDRKKMVEQIGKIQSKIDSVKEAKKFEEAVNNEIVQTNNSLKHEVEKIQTKFQQQIDNVSKGWKDRKITLDEASYEENKLKKFAEELKPKLEDELDCFVHNNLVNTGKDLLEEYKKKLTSLTEEIGIDNLAEISIDPLKLMSREWGSLSDMSKLVKEMEGKIGEKDVENPNRVWYMPWRYLYEPIYIKQDVYGSVLYVKASELAQQFLSNTETALKGDVKKALEYAREQSESIKKQFDAKFKELDDIYKGKLADLEKYANKKDEAEKRIRDSQPKLEWLEQIKAEIESILEI